MTKQEYRAVLGRLPIVNPTPADMAAVCPHLTEEQAVVAFNSGNGCVACPPLRVRGAFHVVSFYCSRKEQPNSYYPPKLLHSRARRTPEYASGKSHGDIFGTYAHILEATRFAEENWGEDLIPDTWESVLSICVEDPSDLRPGANLYVDTIGMYPKTKVVLGVCLGRELDVLINEHHKPESLILDDAIVEMTVDGFVWAELYGDRGGYEYFNCALCGSGLDLTSCPGCGHTFADDHHRMGGCPPLSPKMIKFLLDNGHVFTKDPAIALATEAERYRQWHQ